MDEARLRGGAGGGRTNPSPRRRRAPGPSGATPLDGAEPVVARRARAGQGGTDAGGTDSGGTDSGGTDSGGTGPDDTDPAALARSIALRQLTGAPRSRSQLAQAMARKGVPEHVAEQVLDRFVEVGLIDDAAYAQMLVRSRRESRGLARRALAVELYRKGISPQDAGPALATVDDEAEEASAVDLLRRRWRSGPAVDPQVQARRMIAMLGRKGYPSGLSSRLVRAMVDHDGAEPPSLAADED